MILYKALAASRERNYNNTLEQTIKYLSNIPKGHSLIICKPAPKFLMRMSKELRNMGFDVKEYNFKEDPYFRIRINI